MMDDKSMDKDTKPVESSENTTQKETSKVEVHEVAAEKDSMLTEEKKFPNKDKIVSKSNPKIPNMMKKINFKVLMLIFLGLWLVTLGIGIGWFINEKIGGDTADNTDSSQKVVTTIQEEESAIIDVVDNAMDAVVSIAVNSSNYDPINGYVDDNSNIGSGFIVDSNGLILTNQHVVSNIDADYIVVTADGEEYAVTEIHRDDVNDIALLKIDAKDLPTLELGDSDNLKVGQLVVAIGTPLGEYAGSVTTGVVSGLNRSVTTSSGSFLGSTMKSFENVIQTDAAVNPGNSGGPLLNSSGDVIGINFATTSGADNISFAIPIDFAASRVEEYKTYGKFRQPSIGVSYQLVSEYQARFSNDLVAGALILGINPDSPADVAGLEKYDILTKYDGKSLTEYSLKALVVKSEVGDKITVEYWRDGEYHETEITLGEVE